MYAIILYKGISDPGAPLAESCLKNHIPIHPIPGPSAVIAALSISGFFSSEFTFLGFIPVKGKERSQKLSDISNCKHTVCFFEAPHRIMDTLIELSESYEQNEREITCCRELTKLHEEIIGGMSLNECITHLKIFQKNNIENSSSGLGRIRGEFTVVLGPLKPTKTLLENEKLNEKDRIIAYLNQLKEDGVSRSEAVKLTSDALKTSKSLVYKIALDQSW